MEVYCNSGHWLLAIGGSHWRLPGGGGHSLRVALTLVRETKRCCSEQVRLEGN